jgi:hypothetical protein
VTAGAASLEADWAVLLSRDGVPAAELRAAAARLGARLEESGPEESSGGPAWRPADDDRALLACERLMDAGLHGTALELMLAVAQHAPRFARAASLAGELRRIHFAAGAPELGPSTVAVATPPDVTLEAVRLSARLRPHARGALGSWERALLGDLLS